MKKILLIVTLIVSKFIYSQNTERLSVHFFDVPENLESKFLKFNSEANTILENSGYGKNFYKLYRVKNDNKEKTLRYFQISSYTSDKHYEMTHNVSEEYDDLWNNMWDSEIGKKVWTFDNINHIYRKVCRAE